MEMYSIGAQAIINIWKRFTTSLEISSQSTIKIKSTRNIFVGHFVEKCYDSEGMFRFESVIVFVALIVE